MIGLELFSFSGVQASDFECLCLGCTSDIRIGDSNVPPVQPPDSSTTRALHMIVASIAISKSDLVPAQHPPIVNF